MRQEEGPDRPGVAELRTIKGSLPALVVAEEVRHCCSSGEAVISFEISRLVGVNEKLLSRVAG